MDGPIVVYLAKVYITLKPSVNDPQGQTILGGLKSLGFATVQGVRAGKYFEVRLNESNEAKANAKVKEMCSKLLANSIVEDYRFELSHLD